MSTLVSEFTTQMTINTSMLGVIAMGFLIAFFVELEVIRAYRPKLVRRSFKILTVAILPLALVFVTWMVARILDLIY